MLTGKIPSLSVNTGTGKQSYPNQDRLQVVKTFEDKSALVYLSRYDQFNQAITALAKKGYHFKEIDGNNTAILVTILVSSDFTMHYKNTQVVFTQPMASDPVKKRIAFATPVGPLHEVLLALDREGVFIEHVFDY